MSIEHDDLLSHRKLGADLQNEAAKLAMWDELVEALDKSLTQLWQAGIKVDPVINTLPDRARALQK